MANALSRQKSRCCVLLYFFEMMVWNWEHERIVEKVAGVKMLIDMYNK